MDSPPAREDEPPRRRDGDGPSIVRRASSFPLIAILLAILVVLIAMLLNLLGVGQPQKPEPDSGPIGVRIKYADLLRLTKPYHDLYRNDLPPFHTMQARRFDRPGSNATCTPPARRASLLRDGVRITDSFSGLHGIDPSQRACGIYPTVGKLTSDVEPGCTGTMVWRNVVLTADHCLPWGQSQKVWQSIKFTPAYDGLSQHPELYGSATAVRCVGVDPPFQDGRDMAVCKLNISIGDASGVAKLGAPPDDFDPNWYKSLDWYSIGYPRSSNGGLSPKMTNDFGIDDVKLIDEDGGCHVLNTAYFADEGWSGGPAYHYDETGRAIIGAVVMNCEGPPGGPSGCSSATGTNLAAGARMQALVEFGIVNSTPGMGGWDFDDWNL